MIDKATRNALQSLPDACLLVDDAARVLYCNQEAIGLFGVDLPFPWELREQLPPKDPSLSWARLLPRDDKRRSLEISLVVASRQRWFELAIRRTKAADPRWMVTAREVTNRVLHENALRESESAFRLLFDESPFPIVLTDVVDGRFVNVNRATVEEMGIPREALIGRHAEFLGLLAQQGLDVEQKFRREGRLDCEEICVHGPKGVRFGTISARIVEIGGLRYALSVWQDTTEQKKAQDELTRANHRYEQVVSSIPIVIWSAEYDPATGWSNGYVSPALRHFWGSDLTCEADPWASFSQAIHPDDREAFLNSILLPSQTSGAFSCEYRIIRPNGKIRWLRSQRAMALGKRTAL